MNLAAKELERVAGEILERKRKEGIEVAKGYKIEAVKRERECAEKSKQLEDAVLCRVCGALENEVLSEELWSATFELADEWDALSTAAVQKVHEEISTGAVDMAVREYIIDQVN